jgi:hypothetical protein
VGSRAVAGLAISLADPGGPIEAADESMAEMKSATSPPSREQLLAEVALETQALAQQRHNPLSGFKLAKQQHPRRAGVRRAAIGPGAGHGGGDARGGRGLCRLAGALLRVTTWTPRLKRRTR